jgi:hypothetical protein
VRERDKRARLCEYERPETTDIYQHQIPVMKCGCLLVRLPGHSATFDRITGNHNTSA